MTPTPGSCTAKDCTVYTEAYLCPQHLVELDGLLADAGFLWTNLDPYLQATKSTRSPGERAGSSVSGSRPPVGMDSVDASPESLRVWLLRYTEYRASDVAFNHTDAGHFLSHVRMIVHRARWLVHGQEAAKPKEAEAIRDRLRELDAEPMESAPLRKWFSSNGIAIKAKALNNWVERRLIKAHRVDPANKKEPPKYDPTEVYFAYVNHSRRTS